MNNCITLSRTSNEELPIHINFINSQIAKLKEKPDPTRVEPIANSPRYDGSSIVPWLTNHYCGNKPSGGIWTSTHTPGGPYVSDWAEGLARNPLLQRAVSNEQQRSPDWLLEVVEGTIIRHINSLEDAREFTREYCLGRYSLPRVIRKSMLGRIITRCQTDWQRALSECDAVHLTAGGADHIAWAIMHKNADTAFTTWNCESTIWSTWVFSSPTRLDHLHRHSKGVGNEAT